MKHYQDPGVSLRALREERIKGAWNGIIDEALRSSAASYFQAALGKGSKSGIISREVVDRIRSEGLDMIQRTVLEGGRSHYAAVRLTDFLISFALAIDSTESHELMVATMPICHLISKGWVRVRRISDLPSCIDYISSEHASSDAVIDKLLQEVQSPTFDVQKKIRSLLAEEKTNMRHQADLDLARFIVKRRWTGQYYMLSMAELDLEDMAVPSDVIINSFLFSVIFGIRSGYDLTVEKVIRASSKERPSLAAAKEKLLAFRKRLNADPQFAEVEEAYVGSVDRFLNEKTVRSFFTRRLSGKYLCVSTERYGITLFTKDRDD